MSWQLPVAEPLFTDALIQEWVDAAKDAPRKAKAFDTRLRFSDAGACSRKLAYEALRYEPDDGMDPAGLWVTGLGTLIHGLLQDALQRRYLDAEVEVKAILHFTSGHCDAIVVIDGVRWLYELKTVGGFAFQKAIGLQRYEVKNPEGPRRSAVLQAGLNALAHDCEKVAIGYVALEAISVQRAAKTGLRQLDRILAEWHLDREEWQPLALDELDRQEAVLDAVDAGSLPVASAPGDDGDLVVLDPCATKVAWQCEYCAFRPRCEQDGPGVVPIELRAREAV